MNAKSQLALAGLIGAAAATLARGHRGQLDDPWAPRHEGVDRERVFRGRCPICRRNVARAKIGQVALEKLVRHGKKKGRAACPGSGMAPVRC